ncbi:FlgK family flagellar hook-associated protein [Acidocella sp.]|jgi:flagellar hook-associated protein 1 FlgK|uniref:FlgK family flagellar hook-associated protein n=1 Tax=Acidocella sp. TaxID=50710 RepID=UPI002F3FC842
MSGLIGAMNTALSGIEAFEAGINTVSNNLANVTVNGYGAETVDLATAADGDGVEAPVVTRAADGFAAGVLRTATTADQAASTLATNLTNISNALQNNGDIQTSMNQFFDDVSTLAADPSSSGARETVLSDAQTITGTFQSAASSLDTTMSDAGTALQENVATANNLLTQLATINQGLDTSPNDPSLLDQQEAALSSLSSLLPVNVLPQSNGSVTLSLGGNVLLNQAGAQTLTVTGGTASTPPTIAVANQPGSLTLTGSDGEMGANIATWQAGSQAMQGLDAIAAVFTSEVNTSQAEGLTYNGAQGTNLFTASPSPTVTATTGNPTGSPAVSNATITNPAQLPTDGGPFVLSYATGQGWTATDQATGTPYPVSPGPTPFSLSFAGMTVAVSGAPTNGSSYTINPAPGAATGMSVAITNPDDIAAADPYVATPGTLSATGTITDQNFGAITAGTDSVTTTPPTGTTDNPIVSSTYYGQPLEVNFGSDGSYTITLGATATPASLAGTQVATGQLTSTDGTYSGTISVQYPSTVSPTSYWQLPISGTPANGDTLSLTPGGSSSGSNATRMAALWTASGTSTAGTLQQGVIGFATGLGSNADEAATIATGTAAQVTAATTNLQNIAGVNSDQQAVLLVNYQQAYQAAAQVISTAHTMFQTLLSDTAA